VGLQRHGPRDRQALIAGTVDAFAACGLPPVTRAACQHHHTQPIAAFYDRLAGRRLSDNDHGRMDECFRAAYARHRLTVTLTADATEAFAAWAAAGGSQSLLSMYPHEELIALVTAAGIGHHLTRVDGRIGPDRAHKAPHLHELGRAPGQVAIVDSG
jgi:phosphoglycolate phosphatase-like HAD superfamily hydrolase